MTRNILAVYDATDASTRAAGRAWYDDMMAHCDRIARTNGLPPTLVAAAMAALSPNVNVQGNIAICERVCSDYANGVPFHRTGGHTWQELGNAWTCLEGDLTPMIIHTTLDGTPTGSLKTRSFYRNIIGDLEYVTVDRHATRVAGSRNGGQPTHRRYRRFADAYRRAAAARGETPRDMQAITWIATRGEAW